MFSVCTSLAHTVCHLSIAGRTTRLIKIQHQEIVKRCFEANVHRAQDKLVLRGVLKEVRFLGTLVPKRWYSTGLTASIAQTPSFDIFQML